MRHPAEKCVEKFALNYLVREKSSSYELNWASSSSKEDVD
jgi:hypothetical protein